MIRKGIVAFLIVQGGGGLLWWAILLSSAPARGLFLAPGAPDSTLLAFLGADLILYVGGSFVAAYGLARRRPWAGLALGVHGGAAIYAALYALALSVLSGGAWLGGLLMAPSLIVLSFALWHLQREGIL